MAVKAAGGLLLGKSVKNPGFGYSRKEEGGADSYHRVNRHLLWVVCKAAALYDLSHVDKQTAPH